MERSKEEDATAATTVFLDRASRATRGKRMTKLLDEEMEEDELFWNQDALKEEDEDNNYEEEAEVADEFDSDFDEDEPDPDEEEPPAGDADDRTVKKKRLVFPGRPPSTNNSKKNKKKKKNKVLSKLDNNNNNPPKEEEDDVSAPPSEHHDAPDEVEGERTVRKSTRTSVIVRQAERDAIRAALQATVKPVKRKKEGEERRMTQEEMLLEAAQTEIMNLRNLERVLAREEEVKKKAIVHKPVYDGPEIRYSSKDGYSYLEFKGLSFQSQISTASVPYVEKAVCAVTGLPAKYRDPKTGLPYATKEAFKVIRERFLDEQNSKRDMDMGTLFGSLDGKGFLGRRKRSPVSNRSRMSQFHYMAHFRKIPNETIEVSD
ncbi:Swr1 complex complex subunit Swc2 [Turnera subulata]|uniref:Swr1 complex complex subunit Swc2 n=1 Tax=Turnera subulata TaxID=218843 RepID=A0A9Q0J6L1_9ROSI|nr:Swr1 complex complex subunit Swc2 [Turnera subulata]